MRRTLAFATAISALTLAAPVSAATLLTTSGMPLTERITGSSSPDGTLLHFESSPSNYVVDYSSTDTLHASSEGGFAFVEGATTTSGFSDLTITPESITFSTFKFNLHLPASDGPDIPNGYKTDFTFDTTVFFSGGGSQMFTTDVGAGNGEDRYLLTAGANEAISRIVFSDLVGVSTKNNDTTLTNDFNFDSLRQVSFNAIVPEPATWAMFILGFGLTGAMLRAARKRAAGGLIRG